MFLFAYSVFSRMFTRYQPKLDSRPSICTPNAPPQVGQYDLMGPSSKHGLAAEGAAPAHVLSSFLSARIPEKAARQARS